MKKITDEIILRPRRDDEEDFWREVFYDVTRSYFQLLNLPENDLNNLLEFQFQAQSIDYKHNYPQAANDIILYKNERAGRVILTTERNDLLLVDIAILSEFRNRGIGTKILEWLFEQSRETKMPVSFCVEKMNPAFRLYDRLGFKIVADLTSHFQMEWRDPANV